MQKEINNFLKQFEHKDMFQMIEQAIKKMHWLQHLEGIIQVEERKMKKCEDNWKRWGNWRDIKIKENQRNQNQNNVVRVTQAHELLANTF
jgi:hypothetical protein